MADPSAQLAATDSSADTASSAAPLLCPRCGYDLRGTTSTRCSECGQVIDRQALAESGVPWAHRRKIGRLRAFISTAWLMSADSQRIRQELSKPQDLRDAQRFRACIILLFTLTLLLATWTMVQEVGAANLLLQRRSLTDLSWSGGYSTVMPGWQQDLLAPWNAGLATVPLVPVYALLLAIFLTGIGRSVMRLKDATPEQQKAAEAIALYAGAPLILFLLPVLLFCITQPLLEQAKEMEEARNYSLAHTILIVRLIAFLLACIFGILSLRRIGQWITRAHHGGVGRFLLAVGECLLRTLVGFAVCGLLIPWCVGFFRITLESLS